MSHGNSFGLCSDKQSIPGNLGGGVSLAHGSELKGLPRWPRLSSNDCTGFVFYDLEGLAWVFTELLVWQ